MDGFEYVNNQIQRIAHTEGYISRREKRSNESSEFVGMGGLVWQYNYTLKDHLGNTRVTFADLNNSNTIDPNTEINQINHYHPFGLNMEGNWNGASADAKNKYQYNGKELQTDFGLDWNDYGARFYDAAIGRFPMVDPLTDMYAFQSPYAYAANNPIKYIDFMGMGPVGADGMTNEQWMKSSSPANNGSQAASTAYNGLRNAEANYDKKKKESEYAAANHGATRAITADDIARDAILEITHYSRVEDEQGNVYGILINEQYTIQRPSFLSVQSNYPDYVRYSHAQVWQLIGGNVGSAALNSQGQIEAGYGNTCAARVCYALNKSGFKIKGTNGAFGGYIIKVDKLRAYLSKNLGTPLLLNPATAQATLQGQTGIINFDMPQGAVRGFTGHFTIWNGVRSGGGAHTDDHYFPSSTNIYFWKLD